MTRTLEEISREESKYFKDGWPTEFDQGLNDLMREKIAVYASMHPEIWLGKVNRYTEDKGKPYLVKYEGQTVYNFEYSFAVPCYDEELIRLIKEREEAPYTGTKADMARIDVIHAKIELLKGIFLFWV